MKRKRTGTSSSLFGTLRPHPYGVQPLGNALFFTGEKPRAANRIAGLGLMTHLDDELFIDLILANCDIFSDSIIFKMIQCSKALYVLGNVDEIWRIRTIRRFGGDFGIFRDSWKNTFKARLYEELVRTNENIEVSLILDSPLKIGYFSDYLFSAWRCSAIPLDVLCRVNALENIDRRSSLSLQVFRDEYDIPGKPVILTDVATKWPAFQKWNIKYLLDTVGDVEFRAESVDLSFKSYAAYGTRCRENGGSFEEAPLYLFDKHFGFRTNLSEDFTVPDYFSQDLFHLLGADKRPDYRWLIIGPPRSGSTFHLDPNSTSAWNAVITGSKKWILFPPECVPPGVFPSADGSEVTTPICLAEWFLNHYDEIKRWPVKPIECICRAGEIMYIPRGWWHCVMNLEECIAITQNFVNEANLKQVLRFIRTKPEQVSGYGSGQRAEELSNTLHDRFTEVLNAEFGDAMEEQRASSRKTKTQEAAPTVSIAGLFSPSPNAVTDRPFRFAF